MFDQLSQRLQETLNTLGGKSQLSLENMEAALKEVRRALLEADVSLRTTKKFLTQIQERAEGEGVLKSVSPGQQLIKIVHDELVVLLGGENAPLNLEGNPNIIVMFGLQGSGKTTTSGKLALQLRKKGYQPLLVAADMYRPAAIDQLVSLGKQVDIPVFTIPGSTDVVGIAQAGLAEAKSTGKTHVIIDTAGRLQIDTEMMAELLLIERSLKPQEKLLVIDSMTGQEAIHVAETFNTQLEVTGIVLTKLDGDTRGGAALSVVDVTGKPIKLVGTSEKMEGLEPFYPERMATRILGMGDVVSLVERAQEAIDFDEAKALEDKMRKQQFSIEDFLKMQKTMKRLGSFEQILGMLPIPGMDKDTREMLAHGGEEQMKKIEAIINSMTPQERQEPMVINVSRKKRIAKGCGMTEDDITQFLKQFDQMRLMMKQMTAMTDGMKKGKMPQGGMPGFPGMGGKRPKPDKIKGGGHRRPFPF